MKIYAVCHGQTNLVKSGCIQGNSNKSLTPEGIKQADKIGKLLSKRSINLILASPSEPAMDTAKIIAKHLNIDTDKIVRGLRLYDREFGDYEGKALSEIDNNALLSWADNIPIPNGETIRETANRVFCFMDKALETNRGKTLLLVVHSHVIHTLYWYFNGIPKDGEQQPILSSNCAYHVFDTDKIPTKMLEYQIVLDRRILEDRLKRLAKTEHKGSYTRCFAMCYLIGEFEAPREVGYECPLCNKITTHLDYQLRNLNMFKHWADKISNARLRIDVEIDERCYCQYCNEDGQTQSKVFKIRFSPEEDYHEVISATNYDFDCLFTWIGALETFVEEPGSSSNSSMETVHYVSDNVDILVKMTGLCPELLLNWKGMAVKLGVPEDEVANELKRIEDKQKRWEGLTEKQQMEEIHGLISDEEWESDWGGGE